MKQTQTHLDPTDPYDDDLRDTDSQLAGQDAVIQFLFVGAPLAALLESPVEIGEGAIIYQTERPLPYRYVDVLTLPTKPLIIREAHHELLTRPGALTTVLEVALEQVPQRGLSRYIAEAQRRAEALMAAAVCVLDERIVDRRIGSQLWVSTANGLYCVDVTRAVRFFEPRLEATQPSQPILEQLADIPLDAPEVVAALECYLAALEVRVTPAGFVLLTGALDALCPGKKNTFNIHDLQAELTALGVPVDKSSLQLLVRVRGNLVHAG